jgi:hypothetical protein
MAAHAQTEFPVKPHAVPTQANADALTRRRPCLTAPDIVESSLVLTIRRKRPGSKCRELCISPKVLPTNPGGINIRATNTDQGMPEPEPEASESGRFGFLVFEGFGGSGNKKP